MPNGKRLDDCFADLHGALVGTLSGSGDVSAWRVRDIDAYRQAKASTRQLLGTAIGDDKIHREAMRIIAEHAIREEIRSGQLALWVMFDNVREKVDNHVSHLIDRHTLTTGWFHPSKHPPSSLRDRPLWILLADWQTFKNQSLSSREGVPQAAIAKQTRNAGRPNQYLEAIDLSRELQRKGKKFKSLADEARTIAEELARRHASDPTQWSYKADSIQRALRDFRSGKSPK